MARRELNNYDGKHYRKLFKNKEDAILQRKAWERGEFNERERIGL